MSALRVIVLWHQHQPFYKDLVTGEYRLPWVRLHALKDYYGMVRLLDEFPGVHQTFNLVPSLIAQIQDYVAGTAHDPFLRVASIPAKDLSSNERRFALQYLFQANPLNLIGRYPRYHELWERFRGSGESAERAERYFDAQDFTDLQVLSQLAWFDEFFLHGPEVAALVRKGKYFSLADQAFVIAHQRELLAKVLPAHAAAAKTGAIEISTSPFYHPILPLVCDTNAGAESTPGLPLPQNRFHHPEDAREQIRRGLDLHQKGFGLRPVGVWPAEGSVSEEALRLAHGLGVRWMATDEGVLGRTIGVQFSRDGQGHLPYHLAEKLYTVHQYENAETQMSLIFRDHTISDLIGFVYSGMPPQEAANHLVQNIKQAGQSLLDSGRDALIPIILDGENAWEYYPQSGREFLRRFYDQLQHDPTIEAVTVSEALARHRNVQPLRSLVPGSWINANFNVWIGAPEDNRAWDYLHHAREFYSQAASKCTAEQQNLAFEELLIAEGSDWNWWYGPEHHSANDRDFDELYRKHLSNVYQALGSMAPDYLAQPILGEEARPSFTAQTAYIHPRVTGDLVRYFEWLGAAMYTADRRSGAMHGKSFLLDAAYGGIDENYVYGRLDFANKVPAARFRVVVNLEAWGRNQNRPHTTLRLEASVDAGRIQSWKVTREGKDLVASTAGASEGAAVALVRTFECRVPLRWLEAVPSASAAELPAKANEPATTSLRLRFSLWQHRLPIDALPVEGSLELQMLSEDDLAAHVI